MSNAYDALIAANARDTGLPFGLLKGMIRAESNFVPTARREEVAINDRSLGLMQVLISTARSIVPGISESVLLTPEANIMVGSRYLAKQVARYGGSIPSGVAAYNYGSAKIASTPTTVCLARDSTGKCIRSFTAGAGQFYNQPYVDKVLSFAREYGFDDVSSGSMSFPLKGGTVLPLLLLVGTGMFLLRR